MQLNDLLELINLAADVSRAILGILVQDLHLVQLSVDWRHHFKHHPPVVVEHVLLHVGGAWRASGALVHHVGDDLANLLLVALQDAQLALHHLSLPIHQTLWDLVGALRLEEVLAHFIDEGVHLMSLGRGQLLHFLLLEVCHRGWPSSRLKQLVGLLGRDLLPSLLVSFHIVSVRFWEVLLGWSGVGSSAK